MLVLPIKKKWFDMIRSGEKKEEYREIKPYWTSRFCKEFSKKIPTPDGKVCYIAPYGIMQGLISFTIILKNGYKADSPKIKCRCNLTIGKGKEEWGAEPGKEYYILKILEVE